MANGKPQLTYMSSTLPARSSGPCLRATLEPILDGLPTGPKASFPDVARWAGRTRACRCGAFVPYLGACAPAIDHARARNCRVAPRTTTVCGCSRSDGRKGNCEQNCKRSHALLLQNPPPDQYSASYCVLRACRRGEMREKRRRLMADGATNCGKPPSGSS